MAKDYTEIADFNTVSFTARVLKVDRKVVYTAVAEQQIPALRIGKSIRIPGAWLKQEAGRTEVSSSDVKKPAGPWDRRAEVFNNT